MEITVTSQFDGSVVETLFCSCVEDASRMISQETGYDESFIKEELESTGSFDDVEFSYSYKK